MDKIDFTQHPDDPEYGKPLQLQMFTDQLNAMQHMNKHVFNHKEPWDRLISRKALKQLENDYSEWQKSTAGPESENAFEKVYKKFSNIISTCIQESLDIPLYAKAECALSSNGNEPKNYKYSPCHYFISNKGLTIVARKNIIRTAHFKNSYKQSNVTLRKNAMKHIKMILSRQGLAKNKISSQAVINYSKLVGIQYWHRNVTLVNEANWNK